MNTSDLLTSIKMDLGIYGLRLPFDNPDAAIMDVIRLRSLKTFSTFHPRVKRIEIDLTKDVEPITTSYNHASYRLPDTWGEIVTVRFVEPKPYALGGGSQYAPMGAAGICTYYNMMDLQATADLMSTAAPPLTFDFEAPNILHLFNYAVTSGTIVVEFGFMHADNLSTITHMEYESFYELALLDVKNLLYNTMKHYDEIQSAFGTINLKIDDWANAADQRRDLIERWSDVYHLDTPVYYKI